MMKSHTPSTRRESSDRREADGADLDLEMSRYVALIRAAREKLAGEKEPSLDALAKLGAVFRAAVDTQTRLDRTADLRARAMSQEDYLRAATKMVMGLDPDSRTSWIKELLLKHEVDGGKRLLMGQSA
jgi:hypothetical protein